jgi:hypothetical protein
MLPGDLFPEFGCDGELIELPERCTQMVTVKRCEKCETELSWVADDGRCVQGCLSGHEGALARWRGRYHRCVSLSPFALPAVPSLTMPTESMVHADDS